MYMLGVSEIKRRSEGQIVCLKFKYQFKNQGIIVKFSYPKYSSKALD